jgi:hypothetical protein
MPDDRADLTLACLPVPDSTTCSPRERARHQRAADRRCAAGRGRRGDGDRLQFRAALARPGIEPAVRRSGHAPGGEEANGRFLAAFGSRVQKL